MTERFTRLFSLEENLYAEGAPIVIEAGALQKDNESGRILAQLKIKSISEKRIRALRVKFFPLDVAGRPLGAEIEYEYLDLNVVRNELFAHQTPVFFSNKSVRGYRAVPVWVCFDDGSEWNESNDNWIPLSPQKLLEDSFGDVELAKQYRMEFGAACKYMPLEQRDLWCCSCGALNHASEACCHRCGGALAKMRNLDLAGLEKNCAERLEQERLRIEAEKNAREARKAEIERKARKILPVALSAVIAAVALLLLTVKVFIPSGKYNKAEFAINAEVYAGAYEKAETLMASGDKVGAAMAFGSAETYNNAWEKSRELWAEIMPYPDSISTVVASGHTVALFEDGTLKAIGSRGKYDHGQFDIEDWKNIVGVAANGGYTLGLKENGTVLATGWNEFGQLDVDDWENVIWIGTGDCANYQSRSSIYQSIGIRADGRMYATGSNQYGQCDVEDWDNIVAASSSGCYVLGLRADGTVLAAGDNRKGQCDVEDWTDIISVDTGDWETSIGLRANGTAVAVGDNSYGQCDVEHWTDLVAVSVGGGHTVGLRADGTVYSAGLTPSAEYNTDDWTDIVAISAGTVHTVGLKADGTVVATGMNDYGQCEIGDWTDVIAIEAYDANTVGLRADGSLLMIGYNGGDQCNVEDWENVMLPEYFKNRR